MRSSSDSSLLLTIPGRLSLKLSWLAIVAVLCDKWKLSLWPDPKMESCPGQDHKDKQHCVLGGWVTDIASSFQDDEPVSSASRIFTWLHLTTVCLSQKPPQAVLAGGSNTGPVTDDWSGPPQKNLLIRQIIGKMTSPLLPTEATLPQQVQDNSDGVDKTPKQQLDFLLNWSSCLLTD